MFSSFCSPCLTCQSGNAAPDVSALRGRVHELEDEREELLCKLEQYDELKAKNGAKQKETKQTNFLHKTSTTACNY